MFTLLHAIVLGIIEGFTEFLPVSSTAHLILTSNLLKLTPSDYLKSFEIVVQSGAITAVVIMYWRTLLKRDVLKRLAVAFVPTGVIGLIFYKAAKQYLLGNTSVVLWSLVAGGAVLILYEQFFAKNKKEADMDIRDIPYSRCLLIGLFQSVAIIPGVSRSAATIVGGRLMGIPKKTIVEFSFLLAVPTMFAATGLDLVKSASSFSGAEAGLLAAGFFTSLITAALGIRWLLNYTKKHGFTVFGVYRIALAAFFFAA